MTLLAKFTLWMVVSSWKFICSIADGVPQPNNRSMDEAEDAANRVLSGEQTVHLTPQRSYIRRLQHLLGQRYNVASVSQGREPERSVLFYRV